MRDEEDRRKELERRADRETNRQFRNVLVTLLIILVTAYVIQSGMIQRWVACQQLAPIERVFVRGC